MAWSLKSEKQLLGTKHHGTHVKELTNTKVINIMENMSNFIPISLIYEQKYYALIKHT